MKKLMLAAVAVVGLIGFAPHARAEDRHQDLADKEAKFQQDVRDVRTQAEKDKLDAQKRADDKIAQEKRDLEKDRDDVRNADAKEWNDRHDDDRTADRKDLRDEHKDRDDRTARRDDLALPAGSVSGRLVKGPFLSMGHDLKLRDANGKELVLKMDDRTRVLENGREVQLKDFKEGTEVRASYAADKDHDNRIARDVIIVHPVRK